MKRQKTGFTLIELLVVISIIALLVSILLPALSSAREQAKMAVCAAHVSGLGKAVITYVVDFQDHLPYPGWDGDSTWFDNQNFACYYTYWELTLYTGNAGPSHMGCLYLSGVVESASDIVFCPSFRGCSFANYNGTRAPWGGLEFNAWNAKGDPKHWNYVGVDAADPQYRMTPSDEAKIGWMNSRISYGFRNLYHLGIKTATRAKRMSYLSDVWATRGGYWHMHIDEFSHVSKSGSEAKLHGWYMDGHVERKTLARDKYFLSRSNLSPLPDGFMNNDPDLTWAVIFENQHYEYDK